MSVFQSIEGLNGLMCLIILDFWQRFEYASDTKYVSVLNMLEYSYNNIIIIIIIITNFIILKFLFGWGGVC